ncbi:MAG: M1 family metallopeptidase [Rhizobacter sp.]|nr:M1 family metallopeptidase [Rhizobacter sp.]
MRTFLRVLAGLVMAASMFGARAEAPFALDRTPGKLPKNVVPVEYTLHLVPDLASLRFKGDVMIAIDVRRPTRHIVLNARNLRIESAALHRAGRAPLALVPQLDAERQTLSFALARPLAPGRYELTMAYSGVINREIQGLYYDDYATAAGNKRLLATEHEPASARLLLPCWDEPVFRAAFRLSADVPAGFKAFSNMPVARQEALPGGALQRISFEPTPRMASYLLAFVTGELERSALLQGGVEIGVVTTAGKQAAAAYPLESTARLLRYYDDYFGVRYPLPKLDQIAVPGGFNGAMENWGAIISNETAVLHDSARSSDSAQQQVFATIAHEMAHQWFGNLVTMAWWDNLWLNEGFASWMGTKATDHLNPAWNVWLEANGSREWAMDLDARRSSHAIQQPVEDESRMADAFDGITYGKGQAFLRMLETYLGEAEFRRGIRAYMQRHQYSNATTADLWAALEQATGKPVARIASDWTTRTGFPVIGVDAQCVGGRRYITLTQQPFAFDGVADPKRLWRVPVAIGTIDTLGGFGAVGAPGTAGAKPAQVLLQARSTRIEQPGCAGTLVIDPASVGYFRVAYSPALFAQLRSQWPQLPAAARVKLLSDSWGLARAGRAPLANYTALLAGLGDEPRLAVWKDPLYNLDLLDHLLAGTPQRAALRSFAIGLLRPPFERLGWEEVPGEAAEARRLRADLVQALADFGDAAVIAEAQARFQRFLAEPASLSAALAEPVVHIAGRYATQADHDALVALAGTALTTEEKRRYHAALNAALDPLLAAQTLPMALQTTLPPTLTGAVMAGVAEAGHIALAWAFAKEHAKALVAMQPDADRNQLFPQVVEGSDDPVIADALIALVKARLPAGALPEAQRAAAVIRERAGFKARVLPQLVGALGGG